MTPAGSRARPLTRTLTEIAQALESGQEVERRVHTVLDLLRDLIRADHCALVQLTDGGVRMGVRPRMEATAQDGVRVALERLLGLLQDTGPLDGDLDRLAGPPLASVGWRSHLVVPLTAQDRLLGLLAVGQQQPEAYDEEDAGVVAIVAAQLAAYLGAVAGREQEQLRLRLLARMGDLLDAALDYDALLGRVAEMVVPDLADRCGIAMVGDAGRIVWQALASADQRLLSGRARLNPLRADAPFGAAYALRTGQAQVVSRITDDMRRGAAWDEEDAVALGGLPVASLIAVPLRTKDRTLGAIEFSRTADRPFFGPADLALAEEMAGRIALGIDNARLHREMRATHDALEAERNRLRAEAAARARAEEALRVREARLRRAMEIDTVGVIFFKVTGEITYANNGFLRMSGYSRADCEQGLVRWDVMTPPESMPRSLAAVEEFKRYGRTTAYEKEYIRKDGSRWWALFAATHLDEGVYEEGVEFVVDITETKRGEVALREAHATLEQRVRERTAELAAAVERLRTSEGRLRLLLEEMPAALWITDTDLCVSALAGSLAPALPPILRPDAGGSLSRLAAYDASAGPLLAAHRRALAGEPSDLDLAWGERRFAGHIEPLHDRGGNVVGTIGVAHDVTARTLLRQQEEFIANASHELRSPLTALRAGLGLLELGVGAELGPEERDLLASARANAERLRLHIDDLLAARELATARAAHGDPRPTWAPLDLRDVVASGVEALRVLLEEKGQQLELDLPAPLPVEGDARRLEQIVVNLLANAHRHTPLGTRVSVTGWVADGEARLVVRDTGPGIPAGQLEAIFKRFERVGRPSDGFGLGLAIARDIARLHGGRLWAEGEPGGGAAFHLALPLAPSEVGTDAAP